MKGRTLALGTVASVVVLILMARPFVRRSAPHDDSLRMDNVETLVADGVGDWFWWRRRLPDTFAQIKPSFRDAPPEWTPREDWAVEFALVPGTVPDPWYGGRLSRLRVTIRKEGKVLDRAVRPVDLRDPLRTWKPHHTDLGESVTPKGLAKTDRNVACAIADSVLEAREEALAGRARTIDVRHTLSGQELAQASIFERFDWRIDGKEIVVVLRGTVHAWRFPLAGPAAMNEGIPPLIHVGARDRGQ